MSYQERLDVKEPTMSFGGDRPILVVSLIGVVVGIVALVLGIIAITRQPQATTIQTVPAGSASVASKGNVMSPNVAAAPAKRTWLIGYGHDWGAHEYFDSKGYVNGFSFDLIKAVCEAGGIDCRTVWMPYTDCFVSAPGEHPYGGRGIHDSWVDGCLGWLVTIDRIHIFDFSNSYLEPDTSYFYVKSGSTFDPNDLRNKKIGFVKGWYSSEKCLARHQSPSNSGYVMPKANVIHASTPGELVNLLNSNQIDAIFAGPGEMERYLSQGIQRLQQNPMKCVIAGSAMMSRKGSPFLAAWNDGFNKLRSNGGFTKLCQDAQATHQMYGSINCLN
jgi:ABC-type amino acid transport substrate-binding protein